MRTSFGAHQTLLCVCELFLHTFSHLSSGAVGHFLIRKIIAGYFCFVLQGGCILLVQEQFILEKCREIIHLMIFLLSKEGKRGGMSTNRVKFGQVRFCKADCDRLGEKGSRGKSFTSSFLFHYLGTYSR